MCNACVVRRDNDLESADVVLDGFQRGAREVDTSGCGGDHGGIAWFGWWEVSSRVIKFPPALENHDFFLASSFLEARAGGVRPVRTVGERRVESVSNRFALVHPLLWKAELQLSEGLSRLLRIKRFFGRVLQPLESFRRTGPCIVINSSSVYNSRAHAN